MPPARFDRAVHAARERRLSAVRSAFVPIAVDQRIADGYGRRTTQPTVAQATDLLIIATARVTARELITLEEGQANRARELGQAASVP